MFPASAAALAAACKAENFSDNSRSSPDLKLYLDPETGYTLENEFL